MKKSDLKDGMIIQTEHNRFGVVEMKKNRINICYAPGYIHDEDAKLHLEMLSLDDVYECEDGSLVVGFILTEEMKNTDQLYWVGMMNNFRNIAEEIVLNELIYV